MTGFSADARTAPSLVAAALIALALVLAGCGATGVPDAPREDAEVAAPSVAEPAGFTQLDVPVFREVLTRETIPLRFFDDQPHVAYVRPSDLYSLMLPQGTMDMERQDDGTWRLVSDTGAEAEHVMESGAGGEAVVDVAAGTLTSPDLPAFTNVMSLVQDGMANTYLDGASYARVAGISFESESDAVTIDFSRYGIRLYEDEDGVYLPFQTLSMIWSDLHYNYASYNGKYVYVNDDNLMQKAYLRDPSYFDPILGTGERPQDLADFGYAHLCLVIDYLYGRPQEHFAYADELEELGFDGLLESFGESGVAVRDALRSRDLVRYFIGLYAVGEIMDDGGHTAFDVGLFSDLYENEDRMDLCERYDELLTAAEDPVVSFANGLMELRQTTTPSFDYYLGAQTYRREAYGDATYLSEGDTAVIVFDSFNFIDYDGWRAYLDGRGPRPSPTEPYDEEGHVDSLAIFLDGLERAHADNAVRNVVVDISNNTGGSIDVLEFVANAIAGVNTFRYQNVLTGVVCDEEFSTDANLDGVFDEQDLGPIYPDLNYALVTSGVSFSCANILPALLKGTDVLIMGTTSRGGSCGVEMGVLADGLGFQFSSWMARSVDGEGNEIDAGVVPDVDLVERFGGEPSDLVVMAPEWFEGYVVKDMPDLSVLYDVRLLGQVMDEHFATGALTDAA